MHCWIRCSSGVLTPYTSRYPLLFPPFCCSLLDTGVLWLQYYYLVFRQLIARTFFCPLWVRHVRGIDNDNQVSSSLLLSPIIIIIIIINNPLATAAAAVAACQLVNRHSVALYCEYLWLSGDITGCLMHNLINHNDMYPTFDNNKYLTRDQQKGNRCMPPPVQDANMCNK